MGEVGGSCVTLAERLREHACEWAALSNVFVRESAPEGIREMIGAAVRAVGEGLPGMSGASADLARALALLDARPFDELCTKTRTEYVRLFVGLRHIAVPPHESLYRGDACRMMTPVTFSVRAAYAAAGFEVVRKNTEPDDHIGTELEFMSLLCTRAAAAAQTGDTEVLRRDVSAVGLFLEEHLLQWAPEFCQAVEENDQSGFYAPWAQYLAAWLEADAVEQRALMRAVDTLEAQTGSRPLAGNVS